VCAALVAVSFVSPVAVPVLVTLVVVALLLDGVDGWVARRTSSSSELGARFDMEVDAFLLLVLSVYVSRELGGWVLAIGLMRYAFVAASWVLPWMNRRLPFRYWRKVVTAVQGIALAVAMTGLLPGVDAILVAIALVLLVESFGRDVIWLVRRRGLDSAGAATAQHQNRGGAEHEDADGFDHEGLRNEGEAPRLRNAE
jgi:phosphatidylglycerophosphate synthase